MQRIAAGSPRRCKGLKDERLVRAEETNSWPAEEAVTAPVTPDPCLTSAP